MGRGGGKIGKYLVFFPCRIRLSQKWRQHSPGHRPSCYILYNVLEINFLWGGASVMRFFEKTILKERKDCC